MGCGVIDAITLVGRGLTVTVIVPEVLQLPFTPVTVYVVVVVGDATTLAPVVADNPVDGDHE